MNVIIKQFPDRDYGKLGGTYFKDNPVTVANRDNRRVFYNGKEVSKANVCHQYLIPGRYKGAIPALIYTACSAISSISNLINSTRGQNNG